MWKADFSKVCNTFAMEKVVLCPLCNEVSSTKWSTTSTLCENCGLVYVNYRIPEKDLSNFYRGYKDQRQNDSTLDLQRRIMYLKDYKFVTNMISQPKNVLDIGCGECHFLELFETSNKFGVEIDSTTAIPYNCVVFPSIDHIPSDLEFDLIIFRGTLQYMRDLTAIKQFIDKHLNEDGVVAILALPNALSPMAQVHRDDWVLYNPSEHINIFSIPTLKYMFPDYRIVNTHFPYLDSPYSNEVDDVMKFCEMIYNESYHRHAFWGNMINIGLKRIPSVNKMFKSQKTYVIAEIGINHNGDAELARKLIDVAKDAGADCVKFQKRVVEQSFTADKLAEPYTTKNSWGPTYGAHKHHLEFDEKTFTLIREYAKEKGIDFACTGCDKESVDFLDTLGMTFFKCASGDITNLPLLRHIASKGKPFIISTGMSELETLKVVVENLDKINPNFAMLICTSTYPSPVEDLHLKNLELYRREFPGKVIGYSGHEFGYVPTIAAVAKGAKIVERHITMDRNMRGSDHQGSLEPEEFKECIAAIRTVEQALGTKVKEIRESERPFITKLSKSLCTARDLSAGHVLSDEDLVTKHPGTGISPMRYDHVLGSKLTRDIPADTILTFEDLE